MDPSDIAGPVLTFDEDGLMVGNSTTLPPRRRRRGSGRRPRLDPLPTTTAARAPPRRALRPVVAAPVSADTSVTAVIGYGALDDVDERVVAAPLRMNDGDTVSLPGFATPSRASAFEHDRDRRTDPSVARALPAAGRRTCGPLRRGPATSRSGASPPHWRRPRAAPLTYHPADGHARLGPSAWDAVGPTWRLAVDQAWESWTEGSAGRGCRPPRRCGRRRRHRTQQDGRALGVPPLGDGHGARRDGRVVPGSVRHPRRPGRCTRRSSRASCAWRRSCSTGSPNCTTQPPTRSSTASSNGSRRTPSRQSANPAGSGWEVRLGAFCHVLHLAWLVAYPAPAHVVDAHRGSRRRPWRRAARDRRASSAAPGRRPECDGRRRDH